MTYNSSFNTGKVQAIINLNQDKQKQNHFKLAAKNNPSTSSNAVIRMDNLGTGSLI
jgi:hypothetical protein